MQTTRAASFLPSLRRPPRRAPSIAWLALALLAARRTPAQAYLGEGPGIVQTPAAAAHLGAAALGSDVTEVGQLFLTRIAGDSYYLTATVRRTGGAGGWDVLSGTWNEATRAFAANTDVDHLNSAGDEFACSVSPDLTVVALDTPGGLRVATRSSTTGAFGAPMAVVGAPAGPIDPALCLQHGLLSLAFFRSNNLAIANLTLTTTGAELSHERVLVAGGVQPLHSPSIVAGPDRDAKAVVFARNEGNGTSTAWANASIRSQSDGTPSFEFMDRGSWLANPSATAGTLRYAEAGTTYGQPVEVGVLLAHSTCITTTGGERNLDLTAFAPVQTSPTAFPYAGAFLLGTLAPAPIRIPGIFGASLGLNPTSLVTLAGGLFDKTTGTLRLVMDTPTLPPMRLFVTPVAVDNNQQPPRVFLGNTAAMIVEDRVWCQRFLTVPDAQGDCPAGYTKVRNYRIGVDGRDIGTKELQGSPYCLRCATDDPICRPKQCQIVCYASRTYWENGTKWTEYHYDCSCQ
ncbi:MAG: hypothetical protein R3F56_23285 [Planctomycetota bacterium]